MAEELVIGETERVMSASPRISPFWLALGMMLLAEGAAVAAFYGFEWDWLRVHTASAVQPILVRLGSSVELAGTMLTVQGRPFQMDSDCTYIDLVICSLPLLWRCGRSVVRNLGVLSLFSAVVLVLNLGRVVLAVHVTANGGSWFWSHDVVDYAFWYPTFGGVIFLWTRSLKDLWLTRAGGA